MELAEQTEMSLPRRAPEDRLREDLAELVEAMNCELDMHERIRLYVQVQALRRRLSAGGAR